MDHFCLLYSGLKISDYLVKGNDSVAGVESFDFYSLERLALQKDFKGALIVVSNIIDKGMRLEVLKDKFPGKKIVLVAHESEESKALIEGYQKEGHIDLYFKAPASLSEINTKFESLTSVETEQNSIELPEFEGMDLEIENAAIENEKGAAQLEKDSSEKTEKSKIADIKHAKELEKELEKEAPEDDKFLDDIPDLASELEGIEGDILGVEHTQTNLSEAIGEDFFSGDSSDLEEVESELVEPASDEDMDPGDISRILNSEVLLEELSDTKVKDVQQTYSSIEMPSSSLTTDVPIDVITKKEQSVTEESIAKPQAVVATEAATHATSSSNVTNSEIDFERKKINKINTEDKLRLVSRNELLDDENRSLRQRVIFLEGHAESSKLDLKKLELENHELRVKNSITKKRYEEQNLALEHKISDYKETITYLEQKNADLKQKLKKSKKEKLIDVNQVRSREQELESQLDLIQTDMSSQVKNREEKIMALKRSLDVVKFDLKESIENEEDLKNQVVKLEQKLFEIKRSLGKSLDQIDIQTDRNLRKAKA